MSTLNKYLINLDIPGLEASPADFIEFLNYLQPNFRNLLKWEQHPEKSNLFDVSVPSDTNLFMLGILWNQWQKFKVNDEMYHEDDES